MSKNVCLLALLLVGGIAAAQNTATIDPGLNEREDAYMTRQAAALLHEADNAFRKYPPQYAEPEQRRLALLVLDGVFHDKYAAYRKPVQEFFCFGIQALMGDLRDGPVMDGAMIYKLYNMAFVVRTPGATIAFDLTRGGSAKAPGFTLPDDLMKQLVDQCDVLFISHRHGDHTDKVVAQMFIDAGKPIVAPPQVWADEPIGQAVTRLKREAHTLQTLPIKGGQAELKVVVYPGHQMRETENNVTLVFTPDGMSFCHLGDQINEGDFMEDYAWIDEVSKHHRVDVFMPNCWTNELYRIVQGVDPKLVLPGHENELGHAVDDRVPYGGDEEFLNLTNRQLRESSYPLIVMTWGEWFHYVPQKEE